MANTVDTTTKGGIIYDSNSTEKRVSNFSGQEVTISTANVSNIDKLNIASTKNEAINGEFFDSSALTKEVWESGELICEINDDGSVLILKGDTPIGWTTIDEMDSNIKESPSTNNMQDFREKDAAITEQYNNQKIQEAIDDLRKTDGNIKNVSELRSSSTDPKEQSDATTTIQKLEEQKTNQLIELGKEYFNQNRRDSTNSELAKITTEIKNNNLNFKDVEALMNSSNYNEEINDYSNTLDALKDSNETLYLELGKKLYERN